MSSKESLAKGFCTFCMASFDPAQIGSHVVRCRDRKDDAACAAINARAHPSAFILMVKTDAYLNGWVCFEAHCEATLSQLDSCLRDLWFPELEHPGTFSLQASRRRLLSNGQALDLNQPLGSLLQARDLLNWVLPDGSVPETITLEVKGGPLPTAVMHRPIDVAAFPIGSDAGRRYSVWSADMLQ